MSTRIKAECWPLQMSAAQKIVLISLADLANDEGVCIPTVAQLCVRTSLSERAVRESLAWLDAAGAITRYFRPQESTCYTVTPRRFGQSIAPQKGCYCATTL